MGNDCKKTQGGLPRSGRTNGFIPTLFRALFSCLRIVLSGVSTVVSTVQSAALAASAIVDRDKNASYDQWPMVAASVGAIAVVAVVGYFRYGSRR
ncbi:hypothetical protein F0562_003413 [Nyssa sinensis]|uniref:Uncharacterized protein n=1 Tax=Nyssa sinensis TaxID=561372 RepID=A0A5J5BWE7_9ASTE|nr:hypothetical protein F0562_003413 [Nyssa sinensis]